MAKLTPDEITARKTAGADKRAARALKKQTLTNSSIEDLAIGQFLRTHPDRSRLISLLQAMSQSDDRSAAINGGSLLHYSLERLIKTAMRQLDNEKSNRLFSASANGCISAFSNQLLIAYAFELIDDDSFHDLTILNNIRNVFGHTLHDVEMSHTPISREINKLRRLKVPQGNTYTDRLKFWTVVRIYCVLLTVKRMSFPAERQAAALLRAQWLSSLPKASEEVYSNVMQDVYNHF